MNRLGMVLVGTLLTLVLTGCATPRFAPEMRMADAKINPESVTGHALRWLPSPSQGIPVAVYGIADETGAFKPSEGGQTLSRAVTQAPTPILIKALHDAGNRTWFDVIERENLGNLIKERQIVQEMRQRYLGETELNRAALPALKFAGVLIEGAITGYDTNTRTGGAGARYLGIGAFTQYREDAVSVYLRAVSVKTGEVLVSITAEQRVASVALQGDAFRFVAFQKLLEAEAGVTMNQPRHMAVRQALEKAVYGLIIEGAELNLWNFEDPNAGAVAINHYRTNYAPAELASAGGNLPPEFYAAHQARQSQQVARHHAAISQQQAMAANQMYQNAPRQQPPLAPGQRQQVNGPAQAGLAGRPQQAVQQRAPAQARPAALAANVQRGAQPPPPVRNAAPTQAQQPAPQPPRAEVRPAVQAVAGSAKQSPPVPVVRAAAPAQPVAGVIEHNQTAAEARRVVREAVAAIGHPVDSDEIGKLSASAIVTEGGNLWSVDSLQNGSAVILGASKLVQGLLSNSNGGGE